MAWDLSGLTPYVEDCNVPLIRKTVFNDSPVIDQLPNWVTGIKTCADIGILSVDVDLGDCACGFTSGDDVKISNRQICVSCIQIMGELCDLDLTEYFTGKYIRRTAGEENIEEELYREFIDSFLASVRLKIEDLIFRGDKASADPNLNKLDGILKIIADEVPAANKFSVTSGNAQTAMAYLATKITRDMRARGEVVVLIDPNIQYALAMSAWAICPCQPGTTYDSYLTLPSGLRLIPAEGLRGTGDIIITPITNIVIGTDFANDREKFKFWFSDDDQVWRYIIKFYIGVQIAFPDEVIFANLSQAVIDSASQGQIDVNVVGGGVAITAPLGANGGVAVDDSGAVARMAPAAAALSAGPDNATIAYLTQQVASLMAEVKSLKGEKPKGGRPAKATKEGNPGADAPKEGEGV